MKSTYYKGIIAEFFASCLLILKGYKICKKRDRNPLGEIDIIAEHKNALVFIEVKFRNRIANLPHSISTYQRNRLKRSALRYHHEIERYKKTARFEVIFVSWLYIKHIKDNTF